MANKPFRALGVTLLAALALPSPVCPSPGPTTESRALRIGFLLPPDEAAAPALRSAAEGAAREPPRADPLATELVVRGRTGQWGDDGSEAARLALDDHVQALITPPDGTATHLVLQVAGRTALPVVSLCPDSSVVGSGLPWMVQIVPDTQSQVRALLRQLAPKPPLQATWHALLPDQRAGREIARDLQAAAKAFPQIRLVTSELAATRTPAPDWLARLVDERPPVVLLWLNAQLAAQAASQLRRAGYTGVLAGPERLGSSLFLDATGKDAEGFIVPVPVAQSHPTPTAPVPDGHSFKKVDTLPDPLTAYAHDAVLLLQILHSQQGPSPAGRPPSFQDLPPIQGLTGMICFDPEGRRDSALGLQIWRGCTWQPWSPTLPLSE